MASNSYTPPGVSVTEFTDPSVSPLLAARAQLSLVGMSAGSITKTDTVTLTGTTAVALPGIATTDVMTSGSIVKVVDALNPSLSEAEDDGTYPAGEGGYVFDDDAHTIRRGNSSPVIPDGSTVYVTYTYAPADFFDPIRFENLADIANRFGPAYDVTDSVTTINSPLTYAAAIAFENGAQEIVCQPLFYNNAGTRQQPTDAQAASSSVWAENLVQLRNLPDINLISPVVGQSAPNVGNGEQLAIIQTVQDHIYFMKATEQQYLIGVYGEDSSASSAVATMANLRTHAATLAARYGGELAQQSILLAPSRFTRSAPTAANEQLLVGGQYVAAGIAGMLASRAVSNSLTRKAISGFTSVAETRLKADKNADAAAGLLVVENKGGITQIRHGVTLDTTATVKREISIVRAKHRVIESVRDTLETQIVGEVVADGDAPFVVQSAVIGVLEGLRAQGDIVSYGAVQARVKSLDPTTIEVRFNYRPSFPVNYIDIGFSLDLSTGDASVTTTTGTDTSTF